MAGRKSQNRDLVAAALAAGRTVEDAAKAGNVVPRTVYTWNTDTTFRARVVELRQEMLTSATGRVADGMSEAADVLRKLLTSDSEGIRLRAAERLLCLGLELNEKLEMRKRLEEIERQLAVRVTR